jgi:hypothetical protein
MVRLNQRTYDRQWVEIEGMLEEAELVKRQWQWRFDQCQKNEQKQGMKDAARNFKALEGVIKTLRWVLGEDGIEDPLE